MKLGNDFGRAGLHLFAGCIFASGAAAAPPGGFRPRRDSFARAERGKRTHRNDLDRKLLELRALPLGLEGPLDATEWCGQDAAGRGVGRCDRSLSHASMIHACPCLDSSLVRDVTFAANSAPGFTG